MNEIDIYFEIGDIRRARVLESPIASEGDGASTPFVDFVVEMGGSSHPYKWDGRYAVQALCGQHDLDTFKAAVAAAGGRWISALWVGGPALTRFPLSIEHITPAGQQKIVNELRSRGFTIEFAEPVYTETFSTTDRR